MSVLSADAVVTTVTDEVIAAYKASLLKVTRRIGIYEEDGVTQWGDNNFQSRLISGDITVDGGRDERRSFTLVLDNKDRQLKHNPYNGLWYDKIVKVWRGLLFRNADGEMVKFEYQVAECMIDTINSERFPNQISITGRDYTKKLMNDKFAVDTAFTAGQKLDALVRVIANNGGIIKYRLGVPSTVVGTAVTAARNTSRWELIKNLCEAQNVEVYFDNEGYLVTRPYDDVSTTAPFFKLDVAGEQKNLINYSRSSSDANIFNHIVVTGTSEEETVTGYKYISIKTNEAADSPTSIKKIGRRTFNYEVSYITSQAQSDQLAARLLGIKQLEDYNISFDAICYPWLEANRVLEFADPDSELTTPTRFLFSSFTLPMALGAMPGEGKRIVIVGQPNSAEDPLAEENTA